jgi:hypothetical protein
MISTGLTGTHSMYIRERQNWMWQMDILDLQCSRGEENYNHICEQGRQAQ